MLICTRSWLCNCLRRQARTSSRLSNRWPIISVPLPSGPASVTILDCLNLLLATPWRNTYILFFADRFNRYEDIFGVNAVEFTNEGAANVLINRCIIFRDGRAVFSLAMRFTRRHAAPSSCSQTPALPTLPRAASAVPNSSLTGL